METGVPPTHRYPTRRKLGRNSSHSSLSQEPRVDDKAKGRVFVRVPCKRKRKEKETHMSIKDLPKEVIFNILLFIPAKLLHEAVRYVCKQWYNIVTDPFFVRAHCQMPTTTSTTSASFIIQCRDNRHKVYRAVEADAKSIKLTEIRLLFSSVAIQGSCNGLVLICDNIRETRQVRLFNPLRKLIVNVLPVVPLSFGIRETNAPFRMYSIGVNSSGQYKVVHISLYDLSATLKMSMFTIGVDKAWRSIDVEDHHGRPLNYIDMTGPLRSHGLLIAGFLYWCSTSVYSLAMDVHTETLYLITWPASVDKVQFYRYFISMGTALGLMVEVDRERGIWKLLKLTDVKSSKWTEIEMIDIGAMVSKVNRGKWRTYEAVPIKPVSLIHQELCFYYGVGSNSSRMVCYNLANESFVSLGVNISCDATTSFHHVPTFVSPKNRYTRLL